MPGFCFVYGLDYAKPIKPENTKFISRFIHDSNNNSSLNIKFLNKFKKDKIIYDDAKYTIVLDGCLLNKNNILKKFKQKSLLDLIIHLYSQINDKTFFRYFRGPFCGFLFDKVKHTIISFTNHTGEKAVYYYHKDSTFIVSSDINMIKDVCDMNRIKLHINEEGIYQLLTFAFMEADSTCVNEIKRILPGHYVQIQDKLEDSICYHIFTKDLKIYQDASESEMIELIEEKFSEAVALEFQKDNEYGYDHICDISGGLDSRMTMWVAHDIGYNDMTLLSYGKSGCLDESIAIKIAAYWHDKLIFHPLDSLTFFYDIDRLSKMNGYTSVYGGITGGVELLESLNWDKFGIEHTGMIGDAVLGSFFSAEEDLINNRPTGRYSESLASRLNINEYKSKFFDHDIYLQYTRCFRGAANTIQMRNYFTEVCSPFMYPEFFQLCMNMPIKYRLDHYIYKKWILCKHKQASLFRWEKINGLITESGSRVWFRKMINRGPNKLLRSIGLKPKYSDNGMNPVDYWVHTNEDLNNYLCSYYKGFEDDFSIFVSKELIKDIGSLFKSEIALEKMMALTACSAIRNFII